MSKSYYEKLKDPKWQKKRLEILERDRFQCRMCGNDSRTLHIHHIQYKKVSSPWQYPNRYLIALCDWCHESEEFQKDALKDRIVDLVQEGYDYGDIALMMNCISEIKNDGGLGSDHFKELLFDIIGESVKSSINLNPQENE